MAVPGFDLQPAGIFPRDAGIFFVRFMPADNLPVIREIFCNIVSTIFCFIFFSQEPGMA